MASGNFYGELFYGVSKSHLRQAAYSILSHKKYKKIIYFCCGSFNFAKVAVKAGYKPNQIYCSDIALYPSLLGYLFSNQSIMTMPGLVLSDDIKAEVEAASDEFEKVAIIMWEMRAVNLSKMSYRKTEYKSFVADRKNYINQYIEKLKKEYELLNGIHYEISDLKNTVHDYDKDTVLIGFPPINNNDYEKMFDYEGIVDLKNEVEMFHPEEFPVMFNQSLEWKSHLLMFTSHSFDEIKDSHVFAAKYNGKGEYDHMLSNHHEYLPDCVKNRLVASSGKAYSPMKNVKIFGSDQLITEDSVIKIVPMKAEHSLYYRGLWIHNLGTTSASGNFGLFIDGKIAGVFGIADTQNLSTLKTNYAFLQYTAMVHSDVYANFVRLLEWCATSAEFKRLLYATISRINRFYRLDGMKTISLTKHEYVKASKGIFKVVNKEYDKKLGLNKITEYAKFRKETYHDCLIKYLGEAKIRSRKNG